MSMRGMVLTWMVVVLAACDGSSRYRFPTDGGHDATQSQDGAFSCAAGSPVVQFLGAWKSTSGWFTESCSDGTKSDSPSGDDMLVEQDGPSVIRATISGESCSQTYCVVGDTATMTPGQSCAPDRFDAGSLTVSDGAGLSYHRSYTRIEQEVTCMFDETGTLGR